MKTIYIILALTIAIQTVSGQDRIAENVSFKSGDETITGILVKPNSGSFKKGVTCLSIAIVKYCVGNLGAFLVNGCSADALQTIAWYFLSM